MYLALTLCAVKGQNDQGGRGVVYFIVLCMRMWMCVCLCVRHSPGRHQPCSAVKAVWELLYCRQSSAYVMAPSAAQEGLERCSASGKSERQHTGFKNPVSTLSKSVPVLLILIYLRSWYFQRAAVQSSPPVSWRTAFSGGRGSSRTASCRTYRGQAGFSSNRGLCSTIL